MHLPIYSEFNRVSVNDIPAINSENKERLLVQIALATSLSSQVSASAQVMPQIPFPVRK
jgi:hypothetical protein